MNMTIGTFGKSIKDKIYTWKLFNIIVPVYNETSSIVDFLNSFYSNNISEIKDFGELVIVNDGSNDDTLNKLENYKLNKKKKLFLILKTPVMDMH